MKYRLVIFDSDGTLADTLPWMHSQFNELAAEFGFRRVEAHESDRFRDLHGRALLQELGLPLWKLPRVVSAMRRRMAAHPGPFSLFPGVSEALQRLASAGVLLAVVSSNSRANVERVLGAEHAGLMAELACGVSLFGKAAQLRQVIRQCRVPKEQVIYIGDEARDAEAASQTGISFGAVTWGQHREETLRAGHPAEMFSTPAEMVEKILSGC